MQASHERFLSVGPNELAEIPARGRPGRTGPSISRPAANRWPPHTPGDFLEVPVRAALSPPPLEGQTLRHPGHARQSPASLDLVIAALVEDGRLLASLCPELEVPA